MSYNAFTDPPETRAGRFDLFVWYVKCCLDRAIIDQNEFFYVVKDLIGAMCAGIPSYETTRKGRVILLEDD